MKSAYSVALLIAAANAYTQSLTDCEAVAALFSNTCSSTVMNTADITTDSSNQLTCSGADSVCVGDDTKTEVADCTHNHVSCVTCSEDSSTNVVTMRVQTNTLPNHCWRTVLKNTVQYKEVDFSVTWNPEVYGQENYTGTNFWGTSATESILCDISRTQESNMNAWSNYTVNSSRRRLRQPPPSGDDSAPSGDDSSDSGPSGDDSSDSSSMDALSSTSGIAISGGLIFNGLAGGDVDAVETEVETMDACLAHASPTGDQHYHSLSPCVNPGSITSTTVKPDTCEAGTTCASDAHAWSRTNWDDTSDFGGVYGIARDGHVIYGPYNAAGELWGCDDHDACNGFFLDDQSYGYASTSTFPYVVGCWGPGPAQVYAASCTSSGCENSQYTYAGYTDTYPEGEPTEDGEDAGMLGVTFSLAAAVAFGASVLF